MPLRVLLCLSAKPAFESAPGLRDDACACGRGESGRTEIVCDWLFHPDAIAAPGFDPDDVVAFWDMTNRQDWHVCEQMQLGLTSRAYRPGPYSHREDLLHGFDQLILERERMRCRGGRRKRSVGGQSVRPFVRRNSPVTSDRFNRALFESGRAGGLLGRIAGLVENIAVTASIVAPEILRGSLTAEVAIDASHIDVEKPGHVFGHLLGSVGHGAYSSLAGLRAKGFPKSERGIRSAGFERIPLFQTTCFVRFYLAPFPLKYRRGGHGRRFRSKLIPLVRGS